MPYVNPPAYSSKTFVEPTLLEQFDPLFVQKDTKIDKIISEMGKQSLKTDVKIHKMLPPPQDFNLLIDPNNFPVNNKGLAIGQLLERILNGPSFIDKLGWFPITGQAVAIGRAIFGVAKAIASIALAIFSKLSLGHTNGWQDSAKDGLKHIGRAAVESVPVAGGITTYIYDTRYKFKA